MVVTIAYIPISLTNGSLAALAGTFLLAGIAYILRFDPYA